MLYGYLMHSKCQIWAMPRSITVRTREHRLRCTATALLPLAVCANRKYTDAPRVTSISCVAADGDCLTPSAADSSQHNKEPQHHAGKRQSKRQRWRTVDGHTTSSTSSSSRQSASSSVGTAYQQSDRHTARHRDGASTAISNSRSVGSSSAPLNPEESAPAGLNLSPEHPSVSSIPGSTTSSKQDFKSSSRPRRTRRSDHRAAAPVATEPAHVSEVAMTDVRVQHSVRTNKVYWRSSTPDASKKRGGSTNSRDSSSNRHNRSSLMDADARESSRAGSGYQTAPDGEELAGLSRNYGSSNSNSFHKARHAPPAAGGFRFENCASSSALNNSSRGIVRSRQPQQQQWDTERGIRSSSSGGGGSADGSSSFRQTAYAALQQMKHKSFEELQEVAVKYGSTASLANLMAMFSRLKTVSWSSSRDKAALLQLLWQYLMPRLQRASPRHCTEAMLTASKLQAPLEKLYEGCLTVFVRQIKDSDERILANAVYAVATAHSTVSSNGSLKSVLERTILPEFVSIGNRVHPQAVSIVVYSAALLGIGSNSLDIQQLLQGLPHNFWQTATTQELSNTLWGAAQLGQPLQQLQLQQIVQPLVTKLPEAKPVHITNTLWAVAIMGQQLAPKQLQQMVTSMLQKPLYARVIGSTLWSVGKLGAQIPQQQIDQLMDALLHDLTATSSRQLASSSSSESVQISDSTVFSKPQAISNALHGVATMRRAVSADHLDQLLELLVPELPSCSPQVLTNTLWAVATMKSQISTRHLDLIYSDLALKLTAAEPQGVANAFWAAGTLIPCYFPSQLLTQEAVQYISKELVPVMKPQELSNIVLACGLFGYSEPLLLGAILNYISRLPTTAADESAASTLGAQAICNMCWGYAVLGMTDYALQLQQLSAHCLPFWSSPDFISADKVQLYQLHMWLVEQCGHKEGLLGAFGKQRIEECRQAWTLLVGTQSKVSYTQQRVHEAALKLPELQDVRLEVTTADQLWSMDICATTVADGRKVAIEVDGPFHYRRPDRRATGSTTFRNKALAYRGYVLIIVPWWEWNELMHNDMAEKVAYLRQKLKQALCADG